MEFIFTVLHQDTEPGSRTWSGKSNVFLAINKFS